MTKAENRAAAHAYREQKLREMAQKIQQARINADLPELDRLRRYLIFKSESGGPREALLSAIDNYVEALTATGAHCMGKTPASVRLAVSSPRSLRG